MIFLVYYWKVGRFEFHRQQSPISVEEMITLLETLDWQKVKESDSPSA